LPRVWDCIFVELSEFHSGFWNFSRDRLAVTLDLPGDTSTRPIFWVFSMNRLAVEDDPPGDTNETMQFWSFRIFWDACDVVVMFICLNVNFDKYG